MKAKSLVKTREGEHRVTFVKTEEGSQNLPLKRAAARKSTSISEALVGAGGYLDSQTSDTQIFQDKGATVNEGLPVPKKLKTQDHPQVYATGNRMKEDKDDEGNVKGRINITNTRGKESRTEELSTLLGKRVGILCEDNDGELERKIEKAIREMGHACVKVSDLEGDAIRTREKVNALNEAAVRLREDLNKIEKAAAEARKELNDIEASAIAARTAMVTDAQEANAWMTTRFGRLRTIFKIIHRDDNIPQRTPVADQEIWQSDEEPYYPTMESQIWNQITDGYTAVKDAPSKWLDSNI